MNLWTSKQLTSIYSLALPSCRKSSSAVDLAYNKYEKETSTSEFRSPLVIIHGLFGHKQNWHSVAKAMNKRLRATVFTVDLRNHGDSPWTETMSYNEMAADVSRFLNQVIPQEAGGRNVRIHLLGHSMGGKTAIKIALSSDGPKLLKSLIVEDIVPKKYETSNHRHFPMYLRAMKEANLSQTRHQINSQLASAIPDVGIRQFLLTNLAGRNESLHWRLNVETIQKYLSSMCDVDAPIGRFDGRTLFISGANSPYVTLEDRPLILRLFPNTQFSVIDGSGHWVHADKPYEFINNVANFIEAA